MSQAPEPNPAPATNPTTAAEDLDPDTTLATDATSEPSLNRRILALALPSLGPMFAEPLMIAADSSMVGHLGTTQLAGMTLAASILTFVVGLCIFLVYTTTAVASRRLGEGRRAAAVKTGVDGAWLGLAVGVVASVVLWAGAWPLLGFFDSTPAATHQGVIYLQVAAFSLVGQCLLMAGMGAMRGLMDARTPLVITVLGAVTNVGLNAVLIYGLGLGVAGAGLGTTLASGGMGVAFACKIVVGARVEGVGLRPRFGAVLGAAAGGLPLMLRTLTLQLVILATLWVAASFGEVAVAGRQIAANTWTLTANILDSLAVAAQALIGFELGRATARGDTRVLRQMIRRFTWWGLGLGVGLGVLCADLSGWWPWIFTSDPPVLAAARAALLVSAVFLPLAGVVFAFDGILIGANDTWYLAWAGVVNLVIYLPALWAVWMWAPAGSSGIAGLAWLWACYCGVFFLARLGTLGWRLRGQSWMHLEQ